MTYSERVTAACVEAIDQTYDVHDGATHEQLAHAVLHAYAATRGFRDMEADLRTTLDAHYPADVIPGPYRAGADPGVRFVVKLREALAELDGDHHDSEGATGAGHAAPPVVAVTAERDKWIRAFNRLEAAVTHHKNAHERLFVESCDEALWKARDKILGDVAAR